MNGKKQNCWEFMNCQKEEKCIASTFSLTDGHGGGKNGGRICAYIFGTICCGKEQKSMQDKIDVCFNCPFYQEIRKDSSIGRDIQDRAKKARTYLEETFS